MLLLIIGGGLAGLAALHRGGGAAAASAGADQNVTISDSFFYGQSPPVYPSRKLLPPCGEESVGG